MEGRERVKLNTAVEDDFVILLLFEVGRVAIGASPGECSGLFLALAYSY